MARFRSLVVLVVVLAAGLLLAGCRGGHAASHGAAQTSKAATTSAATRPAAAGSLPIPDIVRKVEPSVVTILTSRGLGSGVVWSADGVIVTAGHVVAGTPNVEVAFADGQRSPGTVAASDVVTDLAVVKTDRHNLPPADFADDLPAVGELAVAIGSPLGFEETVTSGIISGTQRTIPGASAGSQSLVDLLQTDAAISPGNSGGALVDGHGRIVGINEAYIPPSLGAVAIGFAIPSATVRDTVDQLLRTGHVDHAFFGAQLGQLTPEIAAALNIDRSAGAVVLDVVADGPAARAGIRPGDVVTHFGDQGVSTVADVLTAVRHHKPGDVVTVTYVRQGKQLHASVELTTRPSHG
jgi:S1-C subfamily serine protease